MKLARQIQLFSQIYSRIGLLVISIAYIHAFLFTFFLRFSLALTSFNVSLRAKHFYFLTTAESMAKIRSVKYI